MAVYSAQSDYRRKGRNSNQFPKCRLCPSDFQKATGQHPASHHEPQSSLHVENNG